MPSVTGVDDGPGFGVWGESSAGSGLVGKSVSGPGALCRSATGPGVLAESLEEAGVSGTSGTGVGVSGESPLDNGVLGQTSAETAAGVFGRNRSPDGGNGVTGLAEGRAGIGVFGQGGPAGQGVVGNGPTGVVAIGEDGPGVRASSIGDHGVIGRAQRINRAGVLGVQTGPGPGVRGESTIATGVVGHGDRGVEGVGSTTGVAGHAGSPPANWVEPAGVIGRSAKLGAPGVIGRAEVPSTPGVLGQATAGADSIGVVGKGKLAGVAGSSDQTIGVGVRGTMSAAGGTAVWGTGQSTAIGVKGSTSSGVGVWGETKSGFGTGVVGFSPYTSNVGPFGFAARFEGTINVTGAVHKSGGGFRIDHPLEPETKYLDHAFVESDERRNLYDGVVELSADGNAVVELPTWFEALNEGFRYQLTAIGGPAPDLHVRREVGKGSFEIAGGRSGQRISWQITGRRRDPWAAAHPLDIEVEKVEIERGRYRHPELYGQPRERGIEYELFHESMEATEKAREMLEREKWSSDTE